MNAGFFVYFFLFLNLTFKNPKETKMSLNMSCPSQPRSHSSTYFKVNELRDKSSGNVNVNGFEPLMTSSKAYDARGFTTTTATTSNMNSVYMHEPDASIAIHHHHFDAQSFIKSLNEREHVRKSGAPKNLIASAHSGASHNSTNSVYNNGDDSGFYGSGNGGGGLIIPVSQVKQAVLYKMESSTEELDQIGQHKSSTLSRVQRAVDHNRSSDNYYDFNSSTLYRSSQHRCKRSNTIINNNNNIPNEANRSMSTDSGIYWPARQQGNPNN